MAKATPRLVEKIIAGQKVQVKVYPTSFRNCPKHEVRVGGKRGPIRRKELAGV